MHNDMPKIIALKDARAFLGEEVTAKGTVIQPSPDGRIFYLQDGLLTTLEVHSGESGDRANAGEQVTVTGVLVAGQKHDELFRPVMNAKSISRSQ
jgi:hypothetical protein